MSRHIARVVVLVFSALVFASFGAALASEESGTDSSQDRLLAEGRVVYEANCMACHQTDGAGISGVFPPLAGNPNVQDSEYVTGVVLQGRQGELTIAGVTYNGAMPAFSALSQDQVAAVVAYVQEGLGAPPPSTPTEPAGTPAPSSRLPFSTILAYTAGFGIFAIGVGAVAGPVALARRSNGTFTTVQVWLKALAIFVYFVLATVFLPSAIVESRLLASPPSVYENLFSTKSWGLVRDIVGSGVWLGALLLGFWVLRRAQREDVI